MLLPEYKTAFSWYYARDIRLRENGRYDIDAHLLRCCACRQYKDLHEGFHADKHDSFGRSAYCKECRKQKLTGKKLKQRKLESRNNAN